METLVDPALSRAPLVRTAILLLALVAGACGRGDRTGTRAAARSPATPIDTPRTDVIGAPPSQTHAPYRVVSVTGSGSVAGRVVIQGAAPADSVVVATLDQVVCGDRSVVAAVDRNGSALENVIVWLEDARTGKPLPFTRRYTLTQERCQLDPPVQAMVVAGTLNVNNADRTAHGTRFLRAGTGATIAVVHETDAGQTVPVEKVLLEPGRVEVRCDNHPWTRAWLQVFDHPYFGSTDEQGRFALDSIPPGSYRLMAWQPRLGTREQRVTVTANGKATADFIF